MTAQPAGSVPAGPLVAPVAPGRLGEAAPPAALSGYLNELADWLARRKAELDRLDEAALRAADPDAYTGDVTLSMALWQSVSDRQRGLLRLWGSGRADATAREQMSQLIWGRLDAPAAAGGMSLSLVEACRLSDALATQLSTRLAFDPSAADGPVRVAALRAAMDRLRELVKQEPSWAAQVETLQQRIDDVATRAARGGDVAGVLAQLEIDAARAERDLIVTTASRQQAARDRVAAAERLAADRHAAATRLAGLQQREGQVRDLVARCVRAIARAPRLAVPEPDVLGPVPSSRQELDAYLTRLSAVERAMDVAERAYATPLADLAELRGRLDAYRVMAARTGRHDDPAVTAALAQVRAALAAVPCDLPVAAELVNRYTRLIRPTRSAGPTPGQE